ncbi:hypothetical protein FACS1894201_03640 [Bacteroidia bacterium]|nr:hypothetical protein FACS1894201_03640 [Bacteroidia bacterium]
MKKVFIFTILATLATTQFYGQFFFLRQQGSHGNEIVIGDDDVTVRLTLLGKTQRFTLLKTDFVDYVYDTNNPLGRAVDLDFTNTPRVLQLAEKYVYGQNAADLYYKQFLPLSLATLVVTSIPVVGPFLGISMVVPLSKREPTIQSLGISESTLTENRLYLKGYTKHAKEIKTKKLWLYYGIGLVVCSGIMVLNETTPHPFLGFTIIP